MILWIQNVSVSIKRLVEFQYMPWRRWSKMSPQAQFIYSCMTQRKLKQWHRVMQPSWPCSLAAVRPKAHVCGGHLRSRHAIDLSRVMLLDDENDHAGGCFKVGRPGLGTPDVSLFLSPKPLLHRPRVAPVRASRCREDSGRAGGSRKQSPPYRKTSQASLRSRSTSSSSLTAAG